MSVAKHVASTFAKKNATIEINNNNKMTSLKNNAQPPINSQNNTTSCDLAENLNHHIRKALLNPIRQTKNKYIYFKDEKLVPNKYGNSPRFFHRNYPMELELSEKDFHVKQLEQEREEALNRLREEQLKYHALVSQIQAITYIVSTKNAGKLLFISHQIEKLGFAAEDMIRDSQGLFSHIHEEDRGCVIKAFKTATELRKPFHYDYRIRTNTGQTHLFRNNANAIRDKNNNILYHGILTDITYENDTNEELRYYRNRMDYLVRERTQQLGKQNNILKSANANLVNKLDDLHYSINGLQQLLETIGEGVIRIDNQGDCNYINKSAAQILGFSKNELEGKNIQTILKSDCNEAVTAYLSNLSEFTRKPFNDDQPLQRAGVFQHKQQGAISVEYSVYPMTVDKKNTGALLVFREISMSLCYQATHDSLTGVLNRLEFIRFATRAFLAALNDNSEHVLCYLDFDHFKIINDTYGHAAGDELLRVLIAEIKSKLRSRDLVGRMGGDEFAILFEHTAVDQVFIIAQDLCTSISEFQFFWGDKILSVSASIGIAPLDSNNDKIIDVINAADKACLQAKQQGRSRVNMTR